ncbi:MAG: aspartate racemase [Bacteroidetes bacterium GWF2_43_63]|nr:MAG: aspartate racemase [Bacteroidetes bacterium GWE2_42_42]OFY55439.1 MAG: aspartate racemase [Bacteroidetes bacterium GWF2_43_63]HBG70294.1 aspartate racemase [Bacteroidales bacterium]HCB60321.1 aspartate racemase [Bacteroidales bacterium]HCY23567.1 aspartate racemase [Bacteroidales bacterium]
MKTIGLLGGTGWESTLEYYRIINEKISEVTSNVHTAQIVLFSVDFNDVRSRIDHSDYESLGNFFREKAMGIEQHGADCLLLCANTPHMFADAISQHISIPLLHIADATGEKIKENNISKVGLLGTKPTMEMPFYAQRLKEKFGIDVITPPPAVRDYVHDTIYNEFTRGIFTADAKVRYLEIMQELRNAGAEGIIMGCTEIPLLIKQSDTDIPLFDTLQIHAEAAVAFALK